MVTSRIPAALVKCDDAGSTRGTTCAGDWLVAGCGAAVWAAAIRRARNRLTDGVPRNAGPGAPFRDRLRDLVQDRDDAAGKRVLVFRIHLLHFHREHLGDDAGDVVFLAFDDRVNVDHVDRVALDSGRRLEELQSSQLLLAR